MNSDIPTMRAPCASTPAEAPDFSGTFMSTSGYLATLGLLSFPKPSSVAGFVALAA